MHKIYAIKIMYIQSDNATQFNKLNIFITVSAKRRFFKDQIETKSLFLICLKTISSDK